MSEPEATFVGDFRRLVTSFATSVWAEVGAVDAPTRHAGVAIDVEALIALTTSLSFEEGCEIGESIHSWCLHHRRLISETRLREMQRDDPAGIFPVARKLPRIQRRTAVDVARPSLVSLRLRSIFGVNARAEVIGFLLSDSVREWTAGELADEAAHSKRAIAEALENLRLAGWIEGEMQARGLVHWLRRPADIAAVLGPMPEVYPRWRALVRALRPLLALEGRIGRLEGPVRSLEARRVAEKIDADLRRALVPRATQRLVRSSFWDVFEPWALEFASTLAAGETQHFAAV